MYKETQQFKVWLDDKYHSEQEDGITVEAIDGSSAAREFAERRTADGLDYDACFVRGLAWPKTREPARFRIWVENVFRAEEDR